MISTTSSEIVSTFNESIVWFYRLNSRWAELIMFNKSGVKIVSATPGSGDWSAATWRQRRQIFTASPDTGPALWVVNKKQLLKNIFTMDQSRVERIKVAYGGWYLSASHKNYLDAALSWKNLFELCNSRAWLCGAEMFFFWISSDVGWRVSTSEGWRRVTQARHRVILLFFKILFSSKDLLRLDVEDLTFVNVPRISEISLHSNIKVGQLSDQRLCPNTCRKV